MTSHLYPMKARKLTFQHKGGTKSYFLTLITNADGETILIKRWGKVGALGQCKVEQYSHENDGQKAYADAQRERARKGYVAGREDTLTVEDSGKLITAIGRTVYPMVGARALKHLDPALDTTGVRDPEATQDEDGNFTGRQARVDTDMLDKIKREEERKEREAQNAVQQHYAANPLFGRFG